MNNYVKETAAKYEEDTSNSGLNYRNLAAHLQYVTSEFNTPGSSVTDCKLTDGIYGAVDSHDTAWSEYKGGITRSIVFDLGSGKSIRTIKTNFLEDSSKDIEFPHTVSYYVSMDKKEWSTLAHIATIHRPFMKMPARTQMYLWDGLTEGVPGNPDATEVFARYVMITFKTNGLILADEFEIWGFDSQTECAVPLSQDSYHYLESGDNTGNIHNLMLLYNGWYEKGLGDWTREKIIPYISYINEQQQPQEWFFDGILYLGLWSPENRSYEGYTAPTVMKDWTWYLEKTFQHKGDLFELNEAVKKVADQFEDSGHKHKVVIMIPYPSHLQEDFGDINNDGAVVNFNHNCVGEQTALDNRKRAVNCYINRLLDKWKQAEFSHLTLSGLYWLHEGVEYDVPNEKKLIQYASELTHQNNLKFFWIPYFNASHDFAWKELGIDAVAAQSNHFFFETEASRIRDCAQLSMQYGMGVELEFDERINSGDKESYEKFMNYLNGGVDYGYMNNSFLAYYQGNIAMLEAALSKDPEVRRNYDMVYQFTKGIYTKTL